MCGMRVRLGGLLGERTFNLALHLVDEMGQIGHVTVHVQLPCCDEAHRERTRTILSRQPGGKGNAPVQLSGDALCRRPALCCERLDLLEGCLGLSQQLFVHGLTLGMGGFETALPARSCPLDEGTRRRHFHPLRLHSQLKQARTVAKRRGATATSTAATCHV